MASALPQPGLLTRRGAEAGVVLQAMQRALESDVEAVFMEPLRGGQLAQTPPETVARLWAMAAQQRSPADWALQWVWNQPEVSLLLSGMSAMQHVMENVASAERSGVGQLTEAELTLIKGVRAAYQTLSPIPCTDCKYCMPCPNGVNIPGIFEIYNSALMYGHLENARAAYHWVGKEHQADQCIECGECEEKCPQGISIIEWLKKAHALLGSAV